MLARLAIDVPAVRQRWPKLVANRRIKTQRGARPFSGEVELSLRFACERLTSFSASAGVGHRTHPAGVGGGRSRSVALASATGTRSRRVGSRNPPSCTDISRIGRGGRATTGTRGRSIAGVEGGGRVASPSIGVRCRNRQSSAAANTVASTCSGLPEVARGAGSRAKRSPCCGCWTPPPTAPAKDCAWSRITCVSCSTTGI